MNILNARFHAVSEIEAAILLLFFFLFKSSCNVVYVGWI